MELPASAENFTTMGKAKAYLGDAFQEVFGPSGEKVHFFFSPGRANLIGEHTDYNGGLALPFAIQLGTFGAARAREDDRLRFCSLSFPDLQVIESRIGNLSYKKKDGWANYPKGVVWAYAKKGMEAPRGMDLLIAGTLPIGAGLSSSASLEVLTGLALQSLFGFPISKVQTALLAQETENGFCGAHTGIMDPFACLMGEEGHAILLQSSSLKYEQVPVHVDGCRLILTDTRVKHSLASSAYNDRRKTCEDALSYLERGAREPLKFLCDLSPEEFEKRKIAIPDEDCREKAAHVIRENARTRQAAEALKKGDLERFGQLLYASHESLRDLFEVSCPELDFLVDKSQKMPYVLGSRMMGGGFGGCTITLLKEGREEKYRQEMRRGFTGRFGREPAFYQVEITDGAREI